MKSIFGKRKRLKKRKGISLINILGAIAISVSLATFGIRSYSTSQEKGRQSTALQALDAYEQAFINACMTHPRLCHARLDAWDDYNGEDAYAKVVGYMNQLLDDNLQFTWDDTSKYWVSRATDPWGGNYILCEYPESTTETKFDPTLEPTPTLRFSIWATGSDEGLLADPVTISDRAVGVGCVFANGLNDFFRQNKGTEPVYENCTMQRV